MSATVPQKYSSALFNKAAFYNESAPDGRAKYVPNGLRMVETLLLREYSEEEVVVCYVDQLKRSWDRQPKSSRYTHTTRWGFRTLQTSIQSSPAKT